MSPIAARDVCQNGSVKSFEAAGVNYWRQASPTMCKWDYLISHLAHGGGHPFASHNCICICVVCVHFVFCEEKLRELT